LVLPLTACTVGAGAGHATPSPSTQGCNNLALVIGIAKYDHLAELGCPDRDAGDMARELEACGFAVECLRTSAGAVVGPKQDAVLQAVAGLAGRATKDCTLLLYFSGHGFGDAAGNSYLCAADFDPKDIMGTAVRLEDVRATLRGTDAKSVVLVVDAERTVFDDRIVPAAVQSVVPRRGCHVLHAAAPRGRAYEPNLDMKDTEGNQIHNALFTHFLLRGLRGAADRQPDADGVITVRELAQFVIKGMAELQGQKQYSQQPTWDCAEAEAEVVLRGAAIGNAAASLRE
jgi:hypothetical protein